MFQNKKSIPLDKFIEAALYDSEKGFYIKKNPLGKRGDFITAPNISILFSEILSIWIVSFWENNNYPKKINIIELGGGNGEMMYQIINTIKKFPVFYKSCNFYIFEKINMLRKVQKKRLNGLRVRWINNLKVIDRSMSLFVGNEFLDAFPIKQLLKKNGNWYERHIDISKKKKKLIEKKIEKKKFNNSLIKNLFKTQNFIEYSPSLLIFLKNLSIKIKKNKGGFLMIDYGYTSNIMYDSLQSLIKHRKNNFLRNFGKADITYHVNFKFIKKIFKDFGLKINGFSTQKEFLIRMGILKRAEIISKNLSFLDKANIYSRLNRLLNEKEMGNLFKVMFVSSKNINFKNGFID